MAPHQLYNNPTNPMSLLDGLYCEEEHFDDYLGDGFDDFNDKNGNDDENLSKTPTLSEHDLFWEDGELVYLLSKEEKILGFDGFLDGIRRESVGWILRVSAHYGFAAMTALLAVNYLERFVSSPCFQRDKPWMGQLAAVACLSVAAKVEETQVPLLLDFQVEDAKFVFEAKTIQRMELLVLSTLHWKMNAVTPLSFIDHIVRRFGSKNNLYRGFLRRCEHLLLSVIPDSRFSQFLPSVIATATMLLVIREIEPLNALEYENQLGGVLNFAKEEMDECYKLMVDLSESLGHKQYKSHKRKFLLKPSSPNGVIDAYFSCDSSNDSWALESTPEPLFKKSRAHGQPMRLVPLNHVSVSVLKSPH